MDDFEFDFDDRDKLKKYILIVIIIFFSVITLFLIFPTLFYIIIFLGISIPSYILYRNNKKK